MSDRRIDVRLAFDDSRYSGRLAALVDVAKRLNDEMALREATWEPHDWSAFPCE